MNIEVLSVRGLRPEFREVDRDLWLWFCEAKKSYENDQGPRITKRVVQAKAKQAFEAAGISNFKASDGWYIRWIKRWHRIKDYTVGNPEALKKQRIRKSNAKIPALKRSATAIKNNSILSSKPAPTTSQPSETTCNENSHSASNLTYVGNLQPQPSKSFQPLTCNQFPNSQSLNTKYTSGSLVYHETGKFKSSDTVVLKGHGAGNVGQSHESTGIDEESSFLNLDDLTWNDLSDLSCFGRPSETIYTVSGDLKCLPIELSKSSEHDVHNSFQEKDKLSASLNGEEAVIYNPQGPSQQTDLPFVKGFAHVPKRASKFDSSIEKNSNIHCKEFISCSAISQEVNDLKPKDKTNIVCNQSMTDFINGETACGSFAQNDLEDVSVCSDFVNQLNTEQTYELSIKCDDVNNSHPICTKTVTSNCVSSQFWTDNNLKPSTQTCSVTTSNRMNTINECTSPEPSCHMSVVDDDLSSEDNDYISEAVLLSMQEDDFSILNCDQSPFQGTMSVIDENSQSECEKLCTLEEGSQLDLPIFSASDYVLMEKEHNFPAGGKVTDACEMKNNGTSAEGISMEDSRSQSHTPAHQNVYDKNSTLEVSCFTSILPSSNEITNHLSSACESRLVEEKLKAESVPVVDDGGKNSQVSPLNSKIALIGRENLINISTLHRVDLSDSDPDVFISSCNNFNNLSSLASSYFSTEDVEYSQGSFVTDSCILTQNIENSSTAYLVPYTPQGEAGFDSPNLFLSDNLSSGILKSMQLNSNESQGDSFSQMLTENSDTRTVCFSPTPYALDGNGGVARLIACTPFGSTQSDNDSTVSSLVNSGPANTAIQDQRHCPLNTVSSELSGNLLVHKSSKENGFISFDLAFVDDVLSESDVDTGNQPKPLKKNSACLTEKGMNTSQVSNIETKLSSYRRSSGDRYFPYFKEKVVNYAIKHTAKEAARYFGVNVDTVTLWTRGRLESNSVVRNYPDQVMLRWLKRNRESGILLSKEQVAEKATQLLKTPGNWLKDKTRWFHTWASRFLVEEEKKKRLEGNEHGASNLLSDTIEKKALYPDEFKVEVVLYAERTSQNLASTVFNIARRRIFEWSAALKNSKKEDEETTACSPLNNKDTQPSHRPLFAIPEAGPLKLKLNGKGTGRAVTSVAVDQELWSWFCEQTANKTKPKSKEIRAKAVELFRARNHDKIQCSHGWLKKWCIRYGVALRHEGDGDLVAWCLEQFDCNRNISHRDLLSYAHKSLTGTHKSEFKASAGWLLRFCKRHKNLLSEKPSIDTEIPSILQHKVSEFRACIQKFIKSSSLAEKNIGCMDEIPLNFTAGASRSRLLLRRSGLENCHATVILGCLANGELLPPAIIFKGDGPTEQVTYNGVPLVIFYQQDCCMNSSIMLQWIDLVWIRNVSSPSLIVADCYDPHCSESLQDKCKASNITLSIMPPGCSFKLQPLEPAISRLFEANIYSRWTRHYTDADQMLTCKRTSYSSNTDIARWVADACSALGRTRKEAMRRSFEVTGLMSLVNETNEQFLEDPSYIPIASLLMNC